MTVLVLGIETIDQLNHKTNRYMRELKCPKCGNMFSVDEADYASIVNQVKNAEFDVEVKRRIEELHSQQQAEENARTASAEQAHQEELFKRDKTIGEKDGEIARLKERYLLWMTVRNWLSALL